MENKMRQSKIRVYKTLLGAVTASYIWSSYAEPLMSRGEVLVRQYPSLAWNTLVGLVLLMLWGLYWHIKS